MEVRPGRRIVEGCVFAREYGGHALPAQRHLLRVNIVHWQCEAGPGVEPKLFVGRTEGRVVPARGPAAFGWDPIFEPEGFQETYAQLDKAVKNTISHR